MCQNCKISQQSGTRFLLSRQLIQTVINPIYINGLGKAYDKKIVLVGALK